MEDQFLKSIQDGMPITGFWDEIFKEAIIKSLELRYKPDILRDWYISDLVINGEKVLVKWNKRMFSLSDKELKEQYGK